MNGPSFGSMNSVGDGPQPDDFDAEGFDEDLDDIKADFYDKGKDY